MILIKSKQTKDLSKKRHLWLNKTNQFQISDISSVVNFLKSKLNQAIVRSTAVIKLIVILNLPY